MRRSLAILTLFSTFTASAAVAQQAGRARLPEPGQQAEVDPELWRVLEDWSATSATITRLKGEIQRRTYDLAFSVERLGQGYFYYESPDKGRLDVTPVDITQAMLQKRQAKGARVRRNPKNGQPFALESDTEGKWICDGQNVIIMQVAEKTASVLALPPELQGRNIMNGPLPFLFGLPPQQALNRFHLKLHRSPTSTDPIALLEAAPKQRKDAESWRAAQILLDTRTGLPVHVELTKPSGNEKVVYSFSNLTVNSRIDSWWKRFGRTPFKPNISRDWTVKTPGDDKAPAGQHIVGTRGQVVPNLVGLPHKTAEAQLMRLGIKPEQISKVKGNPARNEQDIYRVQQQDPRPGTPISGTKRVSLILWTKMAGG